MGGITDIGFRPERDIPSLAGKVILVTGGKKHETHSTSMFIRANRHKRHGGTWE